MPRLLASPRWRRRVAWSLPAVAVAVAGVVLIVSLPRGSGIPEAEPSPPPPAGDAEQTAQDSFGRAVPVSAATRREVNAVLTAFVRDAVARGDPAAAWDLATPTMKAGTTRADWRRGDLPVYPFPARPEEASGWYVVESFENDLLVDLVMHARPGTNRGAIAYQVELRRVRDGEKRRWLVESFVPERVYSPTETREREARGQPTADDEPIEPGARLSPIWFAVPGVLLSLIVLVPLAIMLVNWRRGVRAEKAYRRSLAEER